MQAEMGTLTLPILLVLYIFSAHLTSADNLFFGGEEQDARYNRTFGSILPDAQELGGSISVSIIVKNMKVDSNGVVHQFSVRIGSVRDNSTVYIQIWRAVGNDNYQLIRTKKIDNMKVGINEVPLRWYITKGDYLGVSCNGFCPIYKNPSDMNFMSLVRMGGNIREEFVTDNIYQFSSPQLFADLAIQAVVEMNMPKPPTTMEPTGGSNTGSSESNNGGDRTASTTTPQSGQPVTGSDQSASDKQVSDPVLSQDYVVWWLIGASVLILVLVVVVLVCVLLCYWRRDKSRYQELLARSRPPSVISGKGMTMDSQGRAFSSASSNFDTMQRGNLQAIEEHEVQDVRISPTQQPAVTVTSQSTNRNARLIERDGEPTIIFDNGQTYHGVNTSRASSTHPSQAVPVPPAPPASPPPRF